MVIVHISRGLYLIIRKFSRCQIHLSRGLYFSFIDDPAGVEWLVYFWTYERLNLENERKEMNQLKLPTD